MEHLPERRATLEQAIDLRLDLRNVLVPLDEQARISTTCVLPNPWLADPQRLGWLLSFTRSWASMTVP